MCMCVCVCLWPPQNDHPRSASRAPWPAASRTPGSILGKHIEKNIENKFWSEKFLEIPMVYPFQSQPPSLPRPNQRLLRWNQQIRHQRRQRRRGRGLRQLLRRGLGLLAGVQHRQWWKPRGLSAWRRHGSQSSPWHHGCFNTKSWSSMTWMIWGYPGDFGKLHFCTMNGVWLMGWFKRPAI